jgi:[methyl-Co(III) methanol-specific corrinoid protein]:coenzyme M methyltransferase
MYREFALPYEQKIFAAVREAGAIGRLHICGDTNAIVGDMAECGADAISVDQKNNLVETRQKIGPNVVLLGNFDPVKVLHKGEPANVGPAVLECLKNGADAVWPGCDLWPEVPAENMTAMMKALSK